MATKLDWDYQSSTNGEYHAFVKRNHQLYRIRAVQDDHPSNPFEDGDCNWPIIVRLPDDHRLRCYEFGREDVLRPSISMFGDDALVHNQVHIAKLLGWKVGEAIEAFCTGLEEDWSDRKYCSNPGLLRDAFDQALADRSMRDTLDILEKLYLMAGWPAFSMTVRGYSQGDWAEVLVVATLAAVERFGVDIEHFRMQAKADIEIKNHVTDMDEWIFNKSSELMLKGTAELYGHWAFGNVYGYVVEKCVGMVPPDDFEDDPQYFEPEWEETGDSCWGFYGPDHHDSGLEEAALECIPDEETIDA